MIITPLGQTALRVSSLSLGGAAIGQQYGPVTTAEVVETVTLAASAGINLIDTSAFYGEGTSERILGEVLQGDLKKHFLICTKAGRHTRDKFDFSAKGMRQCLEGSLQRLNRDCVDILLAHDIEFAQDYEQVFDETATVLHQLKNEGKCRYIGMSCYPLPLLKQAIERCQLDVVISYCHFNLQNQLLISDVYDTANRYKVGILNASPLAMGLLTSQGPPDWHPAGEDIKKACADAAFVSQQHGGNIAHLGMQFCKQESRIPSTITGTAKKAELAENIKVWEQPWNEELLKKVQAILEPVRNHTWASGNFRA